MPAQTKGGSSLKNTTKRGGAREGSGRKPKTYSAEKIQETNQRIEERAIEEGKHLDHLLLDIAYDNEERTIDRLKAIEKLKEYSVIKASEGGEADKNLAPQLFLPEKRAEVTVLEGGKK